MNVIKMNDKSKEELMKKIEDLKDEIDTLRDKIETNARYIQNGWST